MSDRKLEASTHLDPSWKTAEELKITPAEYVGLIAVRDAFIRGDVRRAHIKKVRTFSWRDGFYREYRIEQPAPEKMFNMAWEVFDADCGTSYCIGGWLCQTMNPGASARDTRAYVKAGRSEALLPLFYPSCVADMKSMKPLAAAAAIGSFLSGNLKWWES